MAESAKNMGKSKTVAPANTATHVREVQDVVASKYFRRATERARRVVGDPPKLREIADKAAHSVAGKSGPFEDLLDDFRALIRLVVAYARGHYRAIPVDALVVVVAGLIYVVSPVDLIPDTLPGIGLLDDATVIMWVIKTVRTELNSFRLWEQRITG